MDENQNASVEDQQEVDTTTENEPEVDLTPEERAVEAFDEGAGIDDETDGEKGDEADGGDGSGGEKAPDAEDPKPDETPEQKAEREKAEASEREKAEVDTAVKELGLKGKAEERFRDLSSRLKEANARIEELGGEEGLKEIVRDAQDQREWDQKLHEIGCTPEQFGQAIGYIAAINSSDPVILQQARENLLKEVGLIDSRLGNKTDLYDPLEAHPDLQQKVDTGAIDEEDAIEIARLRGLTAAREKEQAGQQQETLKQREAEAGMQELTQLGAALKGRDGDEVFGAVMQSIGDDLNKMAEQMSPQGWKEFAAMLYERELKAFKAAATASAPAARTPRPGVRSPMRQQHGTRGAAAVSKEYTDPMQAFDAGIEEARLLGR